jgi:hypothetical protein
MQTNKQAYDMRTMSAGDIQQMVNAAKPTSSGDNAALQTARYKTLRRRAETTLKAREADPATYVRNAFPKYDRKWTDARTEGNYQAAVAASIAAQQQIGIKTISHCPRRSPPAQCPPSRMRPSRSRTASARCPASSWRRTTQRSARFVQPDGGCRLARYHRRCI